MIVVVAYKLTFGFAFISVINAVFMQETLNVAVTDDNIMIRTKLRHQVDFRRKMEKLLKLADTNEDGHLSLKEFKAVLHNPGVKTWLESMDMETRDGTLLFRMLDKDGDDHLTVDELATGFSKLRGSAKSLDSQLLIHALRRQWYPDVDRTIGDEVLLDGIDWALVSAPPSAHHTPNKAFNAAYNAFNKEHFPATLPGAGLSHGTQPL
jgi:hypothetical protein